MQMIEKQLPRMRRLLFYLQIYANVSWYVTPKASRMK